MLTIFAGKFITTVQDIRKRKAVAYWLLTGVIMIVIQVLLGGITRLTGSGLSITEWKPIMGALPPLNENEWLTAFEKYKQIAQFKYLNNHFELGDFKFIFFWEWFHRVWARMLGVVFAIGFTYFLVRKYFDKQMIIPFIILFILGGAQGLIGWIMVASGLNDTNLYVNHIKLATHFIAALILLCYTLWFALMLTIKPQQTIQNTPLKSLLNIILAVFITQLIYGGFMAGIKAAIVAPTWPDMNGKMIPNGLSEMQPAIKNIVYNPIAIQFIHRCIAYVLFLLASYWFIRSKAIKGNSLFNNLRIGFALLILMQVAIGILTVLNATYANRLVWLGVSHQFIAMVLLMALTCLLFIVKKAPVPK